MPYGDTDLCLHWFRQWLVAEVMLTSHEGNFTGFAHIFDISLKITKLILQPHLPGANELTNLIFDILFDKNGWVPV